MKRLTVAELTKVEDPKLVREIVTPEGIPVRFTLARAGDRAGAFVLDMVLQVVVVVAILWALSAAVGGAGSWLTAVVVIIAFLLLNFYFAFFEIRWQGATPGKRRVGIRVIDARGGQLETSAVLARNLIRELEVWTPLRFLLASEVVWPEAPGWARVIAGAWAFVFMFMPVFNKDRLRVGDMIAGTRVVLHPRAVLVPDLVDEARAVGEDRVVVLGGIKGRARESGVDMSERMGWVCEFRDGLLRRMMFYGSWSETLDAVGLSE